MSTAFNVIEEIEKLPDQWHGAGSVSISVLEAIAKHADAIAPIENTVETGSGKTTLLFSHLSKKHFVFARDDGNSISVVKNSVILNASSVTFIEGSTQKTLPGHTFTDKIDIALIDGPHGYPFPDMEYYYFYPLIAQGGLLLLDDIQIPSITRMFEIIDSDDMFKLLEIVHNMAFFQRSDAPLIDPLSDSWWLQGYNRPYYEQISLPKRPAGRFSYLKSMIPKSLRKRVSRLIRNR